MLLQLRLRGGGGGLSTRRGGAACVARGNAIGAMAAATPEQTRCAIQ